MDNRHAVLVVVGIAAVVGVLVFALRPRTPAFAGGPGAYYPEDDFPPPRRSLAQPYSVDSAPRPSYDAAGRYKNAEEWEITWNKDFLPTKLVIHRDATRS